MSRGTRVLARPVARDRHVATRGLVLQPQLRPGLAEPEAAASRLVAAVDQGSSPQSRDRLRKEMFYDIYPADVTDAHRCQELGQSEQFEAEMFQFQPMKNLQ